MHRQPYKSKRWFLNTHGQEQLANPLIPPRCPQLQPPWTQIVSGPAAKAEQQIPVAQKENRAGVRDFEPLQSICKGDEEQSCKQLPAVRHKGHIDIRKGFLISMSTARGDQRKTLD